MVSRPLHGLLIGVLLSLGIPLIMAQSEKTLYSQASTLRQNEADTLLNEGIDQFLDSQFQNSLWSLEQALVIYREIGDRDGESVSLGNLGNVYLSLGEYRQAIDFLQKSLSIQREMRDSQGEAAALGSLGLAYFSLGEHEKAVNFHQQSLAINRRIGDRKGEANSLGNLGGLYYSQSEYQRAIDFYLQSLEIAKEIPDRRSEASSLNNLGNVYRSLGRYGETIDYYQQSLSLAFEIGFQEVEADSLGNLGVVYHSLGQYEKAIDFHQRSLAIKEKIGDKQGEVNSLDNMGTAYRRLDQSEKAIEFHQRALNLAREIGYQQGEENSLGNLGSAYSSLRQHDKAIDIQQQSLALAQMLGNRQGEAASLGNLGVAYNSLGQYEKAIDFFQQQLVLVQEIGDPLGEANSLNNQGLSFFQIGQIEQASEQLFTAVKILESLRSLDLNEDERISLFEIQQQTYRFLQQALVAQQKYDEALEVAERGRTRVFLESTAERLSLQGTATGPILPPTLTDLQTIAQNQNATLVEYSIILPGISEPALYIWILSPDGQLTFRQTDLNSEGIDIESMREGIGVRHRGGFDLADAVLDPSEHLEDLYQLLIEPIADLLPTDPNSPIIFVPHRELFLVPFAALKDPNGQYLIENHTILTAPSIQLLDLTRQQRIQRPDPSPADLLIVGNPTMPELWDSKEDVTQPLSDLPGAEVEALTIANTFATQALIGAAATEPVIKQQMSQSRIIHLATHGLLEYGSPQDSGVRDLPGAIALAPTQDEDGLLTSAEILELDLQADLVVLSACDTGRGRISGDGVIGLSRSLIVAGTPSVIVSLWSVPDSPTADLMTEFYRQWQQEGMTKAQALRQAMLLTMEDHPDPRDWAAFILIGEAQ